MIEWDTALRALSAMVWTIAAFRVIADRHELPDAFRRILGTLSLATVLVVIALGPLLAPTLGAWFVRTLYTATATAVLIVGVAFATVRVR